MITRRYAILALLLTVFFSGTACAHKISDSYLRLQVDGRTIQGQWDIALLDLATTAGLDRKSQNDPQAIKDFALENLSVSSNAGLCALHITPPVKARNEDATSPDIEFEGQCPDKVTSLTIDYSAFLAIDLQYREMVSVTAEDRALYTETLSRERANYTFQLSGVNRWQQFKDYLHEGIWHIWLGYDHILFLISLLLSASFVVANGDWQPRDGFAETFLQVLKIVTAFTLAHSITLGLVIFDVIALPSRLVELTIAISIAIAALNNLRPAIQNRLWLLTFFFGLIHGMGFASALKELGIPGDARWVTLVGFNLGVEIGQLTIVAAVLPLIYTMRNIPIYRKLIFRAVSVLIIVMAMLWFVQRAFAITLLNGTLGT